MAAKRVPIIAINGLLALLLLYYASMQIPVAGLLIGAFMPLPVILTIRRAGWLTGFLLVAAAVGVMLYLEQVSGFKGEILPLVHMAVIGLAVSFFASRAYPLEIIVSGAVLLAVSLQVGVFFILAGQQGLSPLAYLQRTLEEVWRAVSHLLSQEQLLDQGFPLAGLNLEEITSLIAQITPAILLINNSLVVILNYQLSRYLGDQQGWQDHTLPLACWEAPGWLVFILIGAGFALLVPSPAVHMTGVNLLLICGLIYFLQGLAIIAFSFRRFQVPRIFRWTGYLLLVMIKPAMLLVILMGLIDLWLDFRHLHSPPSEV